MKKLLFTHGIDIDGYGCAVLAKLAWGDSVDIVYADNFDLDDKFVKIWGKTGFAEYNEIFVTDHCLGMALCNMVEKKSNIKKKIKIFDHHSSRIGNQDKFSWVSIISERDGKKESGTSLFYDYLCEKGLLESSDKLETWVELTRLYDTWEWKKFDHQKANDLNTLALSVGREEYIRRLYQDHVLNENFDFNAQESQIIEKYKIDFQKQIKRYVQQIRVVEIDGARAGFVEILDVFKNDIGGEIKKNGNENNIAFLIMPVKDRNTVSLRVVDDNFDVSKVAEKFGGGGHKGAASFPLSSLPKDLIFKEKI